MLNLIELYPLPAEKDFPHDFTGWIHTPQGISELRLFFSPTEHQGADQSLHSCCVLCQCVFCTTKKENPDCSKPCCTHHHLPLNPSLRKAFVPTVSHSQHGLVSPKPKAGTSTSPYSEPRELSLPCILPPLSHMS